ncbi:MAG: hypothetical protein JXA95_07125 [Spirochaetales bacterium]|nr:hypothetical protein [Spirochaetales bacterium]
MSSEEKKKKNVSIGSLFKTGVGIVGIILVLALVFSAFERNTEGFYVVRQGATGKVDIISKPVFYWALMAKTWSYPISFEIFLSKSDQDGGSGADTQAVKVIFNDGSYADLSSVTKVTVPDNEDLRLKIHKDFKSAPNFQANVRRYVEAVLKRSGTLFKAEEAYASKRTQLENAIDSQLRNGKFTTEPSEELVDTGEVDEDGDPILVKEKRTIISRDETGQPIIEDQGFIRQYDLNLNYFNLTDVDPDDKTLQIIQQKKEADMLRVLAQTQAEKAKQDAITAEEEGKAAIARARAEQEVIKATEVTQAEKNKRVAELKAEEELSVAKLNRDAEAEKAEAQLIKERAEAEANRLKVQAGLTPQQKAEFDLKIADAISKNIAQGLAQADFPDVVVTGGGANGSSGIDLVSMMGINQAMELVEKMSANTIK